MAEAIAKAEDYLSRQNQTTLGLIGAGVAGLARISFAAGGVVFDSVGVGLVTHPLKITRSPAGLRIALILRAVGRVTVEADIVASTASAAAREIAFTCLSSPGAAGDIPTLL
jgi:ornithine cyclodeaminase/alanine dehydrogenase-like protein (mu-crystallin family)